MHPVVIYCVKTVPGALGVSWAYKCKWYVTQYITNVAFVYLSVGIRNMKIVRYVNRYVKKVFCVWTKWKIKIRF